MRLWKVGVLLSAPVVTVAACGMAALFMISGSGSVLTAAAGGLSQECSAGIPSASASFGNATGAALAAKAAQVAGFTGTDLVTAVAVAGAESGYNPTARNSIGASGLWQILQSAHQGLWSMGDWRDPAVNARMAYSVWHAAHGWTPWTTWTGGSYRSHLSEAQAAVSALGAAVPPPAACADNAGLTTPPAGPAPASWDQIGNPRTVTQAMSWADGMVGVSVPVGACDHYVALAYGWPNSGSTTALVHWQTIPTSLHYQGAAPQGALMFWSTGWAGHVAISDGSDGVYSTDASSSGYTAGIYGHVAKAVIDHWGPFLGWTPPLFPGHVGIPRPGQPL